MLVCERCSRLQLPVTEVVAEIRTESDLARDSHGHDDQQGKPYESEGEAGAKTSIR